MFNVIVIDRNNKVIGGGVLEDSFRNLLPEDTLVVDSFPSGNLQDYSYINGKFVLNSNLKKGG